MAGMRLEGQAVNSEPLYRRALAIRKSALGAAHPDTASSLDSLGASYFDQNKYRNAESLFRRALAIREKVLGGEHPDVARSLKNLAAVCYGGLKHYVESESLYRRALAILEESLGRTHPEFAASLEYYAETLRKLKRKDEAIEVEQRAKGLLASTDN
jgi:tetratricopeptide (TPR) repeat protein